jgi:hypothetical protein
MAWPTTDLAEWLDTRYISYALAKPPKEPRKEDWLSDPGTWEY